MSEAHLATFRVDITPDGPAWLAGYQFLKQASGTVFLPLECNGLVCRADGGVLWVLLSVDTLFSSDVLRREIIGHLADQGGPHLDPDRLLIVATHTHFAPILDDTKPLLGTFDARLCSELAGRIAAALRDALAVPGAPADCAYAEHPCNGAVYRRRDGIWQFRRRFPWLVREAAMLPDAARPPATGLHCAVIGEPQAPRALVWTWPCHALATPFTEGVSSDFPGEVRRRIRRHLGQPDLPVLYLPGFCGDLRPAATAKTPSARAMVQWPLYFGDRFILSDRAFFDEFCTGIETALVAALDQVRPLGPVIGRDPGRAAVDLPGLVRTADGDPVSIPMARLDLGVLRMILLGAEVCSGYHEILQPRDGTPCLMSGYFDRCFGYLPTDGQIPEGGYEVDGFLKPFSLKGAIAPGTGARIADGLGILN